VLGDESVGLGRPALVIHGRAEHDRVVGVERLDLVDSSKVDGGAGVGPVQRLLHVRGAVAVMARLGEVPGQRPVRALISGLAVRGRMTRLVCVQRERQEDDAEQYLGLQPGARRP
jgi:hypothetical protein